MMALSSTNLASNWKVDSNTITKNTDASSHLGTGPNSGSINGSIILMSRLGPSIKNVASAQPFLGGFHFEPCGSMHWKLAEFQVSWINRSRRVAAWQLPVTGFTEQVSPKQKNASVKPYCSHFPTTKAPKKILKDGSFMDFFMNYFWTKKRVSPISDAKACQGARTWEDAVAPLWSRYMGSWCLDEAVRPWNPLALVEGAWMASR